MVEPTPLKNIVSKWVHLPQNRDESKKIFELPPARIQVVESCFFLFFLLKKKCEIFFVKLFGSFMKRS